MLVLKSPLASVLFMLVLKLFIAVVQVVLVLNVQYSNTSECWF